MTPMQAQAAQVMASEAVAFCAARGLSRARSLTLVLFANAWGESRWGANPVQPDGGGRGLFQADVHGGLGLVWIQAGGKAEQLLDPVVNTRLILWEAGRSASFMAALRDGTVGDAIRAFVYYVERPKDKAGDTIERQGFAKTFGGRSDVLSIRTVTYG